MHHQIKMLTAISTYVKNEKFNNNAVALLHKDNIRQESFCEDV